MAKEFLENGRKKVIGIYEIVINDKKYIGSTTNMNKRLTTHLSKMISNTHDSKLVQNEYNLKNSVTFRILKILENDEKLKTWEQVYIKHFKAISHGLNQAKAKNIDIVTKNELCVFLYGCDIETLKLLKAPCYKIDDTFYYDKFEAREKMKTEIGVVYGK